VSFVLPTDDACLITAPQREKNAWEADRSPAVSLLTPQFKLGHFCNIVGPTL